MQKLIILILLLLPNIAMAKNKLSELNFVGTSNIDYYCQEEVAGCLDHNTKTIYLNLKNNQKFSQFVLGHEICHWLIDNNEQRI